MPLNKTRIKALCFDVDGTLSDTDDLYAKKVSKFMPRFLFRDPDHAARRFVMWIEAPGNALLGLADTLHLDDEMVAVIDWLSRHRHHSAKEFLLVPGVDEMLKQLHGRYPMSVVTARDEKGTMAFLERFDLVKYFDAVVTGLSARHTKPYPDPILLAAEKMGVSPEHCLMIGDTTVDIRAGKAAAHRPWAYCAGLVKSLN
jgi:N-acetyl-D-muramate 6-phosphate phosphatase